MASTITNPNFDQSDFQRIAPRYLDGEASAGEASAIESYLLASPRAQAEVELLERESAAIGRAFARPPEDISRIIIRVRRRNPHRKIYVSPLLALGGQVLLLAFMFWFVVRQTGELAPPPLKLESLEGAVEVDGAGGKAGSTLSTNDVIRTGPRAQARILVGISDSISLNENSSAILRAPRPGIRHVVELESGELWGRFVDEQSGFAVALTGLSGVEITGRHGEIDAGAGKSAATPLLPRGFTVPDGRTVTAVIRLMRGAAMLRTPSGSMELPRGKPVVIYEGGTESVVVDDPDAASYAVLRLSGPLKFKQTWDWLNVRRYPLSREAATYELWKDLAAIAGEITAKRESLPAWGTSMPLTEYRAALRAQLDALRQKKVDPLPPEDLDKVLALEFDEQLKLLPATAAPTAEAERLLMALAMQAEAVIKGWEKQQPEYLPLAACADISGAVKVLANMEQEAAVRLRNAAGPAGVGAADFSRSRIGPLDVAVEAAKLELAKRQANPLRENAETRRAELQAQHDKLHDEIKQLRRLQSDLELKRIKLQPYDKAVEDLKARLHPVEEALRALNAQLAACMANLALNKYAPEALAAADKALADATALLAQRQTLTEDARAKREVKNSEYVTASAASEAAAKVHVDAVDAWRRACEAAAPFAATEAVLAYRVAALTEIRTRYKRILDAIDPAKRKGSEEEAEFNRIDADYREALNALKTASRMTDGPRSECVRLAGLRNAAEAASLAARAAQDVLGKELAALDGILADETRKLDEAGRARADAQTTFDFQVAEKKRREELDAEKATLDSQIAPRQIEAGTLSTELREAEARREPFKKDHDELFLRISELPAKEAELRRHESGIEQIDAVELLVLRAWQDLAKDRDDLLRELRSLLNAEIGVSRLLGAPGQEPSAEIAVLAAELAQHRARASKEVLSTLERGSAHGDADTVGQNLDKLYREQIDSMSRVNKGMFTNQRTRRLAFAWLRNRAETWEAAALADNQRIVDSYRAQVQVITGFGVDSRAPGSVLSILSAGAGREYKGIRFVAPEEGQPDEYEAVLELQWNLFCLTDIRSEQESRLDATSRNKAMPPRSYYAALMSGPGDSRLMAIDLDWASASANVLSKEKLERLTALSGAAGEKP